MGKFVLEYFVHSFVFKEVEDASLDSEQGYLREGMAVPLCRHWA